MASKLCERHPLTVQIIVLYADSDLVSTAALLAMEGCLLGRLRWDLAAPTSLDFLQLLLPRFEGLTALEEPVVRLLSRAAREYQFCTVRPSVLAAAALLTALQMARDKDKDRAVSMQSPTWKQLQASLAILLNVDKVRRYSYILGTYIHTRG